MKLLQQNKKALFNYEILSKYNAGICLTGGEVKSILNGEISMSEGWIKIEEKHVLLKQVHINKYKNSHGFEDKISETRDRILLLKKDEIRKIRKESIEKSITIIPLSIFYSDTKKIKITIAVCRGKKLYDKRQTIKERDMNLDRKREERNITRRKND
jgi:SsrA-binding protein